MFVDTHAHLYAKEFDEDRKVMLTRCIDNSVDKIYLPNINAESIEGMLDLEKEYQGLCFAMMGLHPCYVKENYEEELQIIKSWLDQRPFCAIGEIGIDLHWDKTFIEAQKKAFRLQIQWAKKLDRPIVIHARNSMEEILEIVEDENNEKLRGIFHCFSGNQEQVQRILNLNGFYFGIGGSLTFKNSGKSLRDVVGKIDMKYIVLETDAPYLSPAPLRGKRNESSNIPVIAERLAALKGLSLEEVAEITKNNSEKVFFPFV